MPACEGSLALAFAQSPDSVMNEIFDAHDDFLRRMARLLCGNIALAEDVVQETWLRAWKSLPGLREAKSVRAWLMVILKRELARYYARRDSAHVSLEDVDVDPGAWSTLDAQIQAEQLLASLDEGERRLLLGHLVDGLSYQELANRHASAVSTVGVRLHRIRKRLAAF